MTTRHNDYEPKWLCNIAMFTHHDDYTSKWLRNVMMITFRDDYTSQWLQVSMITRHNDLKSEWLRYVSMTTRKNDYATNDTAIWWLRITMTTHTTAKKIFAQSLCCMLRYFFPLSLLQHFKRKDFQIFPNNASSLHTCLPSKPFLLSMNKWKYFDVTDASSIHQTKTHQDKQRDVHRASLPLHSATTLLSVI